MVALLYLAVLVIAVAGVVLLARRREITDEEYEKMKGKGSAVGNALLEAQILLEPGRESLLKAKEEIQVEEDDSGDPPSR